MKQLFFYLGFFLILSACQTTESAPKAVNSDAEITQRINEMYSIYGKSAGSLYEVPFADSIFSPDLKQTLIKAVDRSNESIQEIKKSAHPEDKPILFEGSVFTSLYDGYTSYKIVSVKMLSESNPGKAEVNVEFENSNGNPKIVWNDKINMINYGDGWKIDNIIFDQKINATDLKNSLKDFMNAESN